MSHLVDSGTVVISAGAAVAMYAAENLSLG